MKYKTNMRLGLIVISLLMSAAAASAQAMKTNKYLFFLPMLLALVFGIMGCSKDDEKNDDMIEPVISNDLAITRFFESEWPCETFKDGAFFVGKRGSFCKVLNSREELQSVYYGDLSLPDIDFNAFSLLIGQVEVPHSGYTLTKMELYYDNPVVNVYAKEAESGYTTISYIHFWNLYPKIDSEEIIVKLIVN